jgi:sugar phosphate isomerase/epimerase
MDTATNRQLPAKAQIALVKELGYAGIGCDMGQMPAMLQAADEAGVKLFSVYVGANVDPAKPRYDPRLKEVIASLKGRDTLVWLFITGAKPSTTDRDEQAVATLREIADLAAEAGLRVALYPHAGFYVERVEDALRLVKKADRKNVGVTFNLCHWLKVDKEENLKPLLTQALPRLYLVTINGADSGGQNWDTLIQTLDRGTFDNFGLLKTLKELGYIGPIGFQGYGIKGDARDILERTMNGWRKLSARLAAE